MVVGAEIHLRKRSIVAVIAINAGMIVTGSHVQLVMGCVIDTAEIPYRLLSEPLP